jgi:hypothetical protein
MDGRDEIAESENIHPEKTLLKSPAFENQFPFERFKYFRGHRVGLAQRIS